MFPSRQRPRSPGLESCLWLCLGGQRPHLSHLYRCWHHTWGGLGPGWWSPKGLRLLPTLPDPQTPPPPLQHLHNPPPPPWPLSFPFPALSLLYLPFVSQGKCHLPRGAFPDPPSQSHALVVLHQLFPRPHQTAITQPFMRFPVPPSGAV